jgi:shikimate kinase
MSANGMAVAAATGDDDALRICNQAIVNGAISAAITGSGPVISVVCFSQEHSTMREYLSRTDYEIIETNFSNKKLTGLVNL